MPKPKSKRQKTETKTTVALAASNLPEPQRVPKAGVGEVVQDFISFGGATAVEARQEADGMWLVTAMA